VRSAVANSNSWWFVGSFGKFTPPELFGNVVRRKRHKCSLDIVNDVNIAFFK
jgi:hypothetical protein